MNVKLIKQSDYDCFRGAEGGVLRCNPQAFQNRMIILLKPYNEIVWSNLLQTGCQNLDCFSFTPLKHHIIQVYKGGNLKSEDLIRKLNRILKFGENDSPIIRSDTFASFYNETYLSVFRYIYGLTGGPPAEVEDLTAETYMRAWKSRDGYRGEADLVIGWVLRIARNLVIDSYRRDKNNRSSSTKTHWKKMPCLHRRSNARKTVSWHPNNSSWFLVYWIGCLANSAKSWCCVIY